MHICFGSCVQTVVDPTVEKLHRSNQYQGLCIVKKLAVVIRRRPHLPFARLDEQKISQVWIFRQTTSQYTSCCPTTGDNYTILLLRRRHLYQAADVLSGVAKRAALGSPDKKSGKQHVGAPDPTRDINSDSGRDQATCPWQTRSGKKQIVMRMSNLRSVTGSEFASHYLPISRECIQAVEQIFCTNDA